jgi:hypothetical protein
MFRHFVRYSVWSRWTFGLVLFSLGSALSFERLQPHGPGRVADPAAWALAVRAEPVSAAVVLLVPAVGLWLMARAAYLTLWPHRHPVFARLRLFGPVAEVVASLDGELGGPDARALPTYPSHRLIWLTPSWAVQFGGTGLAVVRLADLVWVRRVTVGGVAAVSMGLRQGVVERFYPEDAERLIFEVQARLPWVLEALDERWERDWQTNPEGIVRAVEVVERRRQEVQSRPDDPGREGVVRD